MSDDLVKRARHNALSDMPHYASVELIEALADRIEELEENLRLRTAERNYANDVVNTYVEQVKELEAKLAQGTLVEYDDGSRVSLSAFAGGASEGGAWSHLTLMKEEQDGAVSFRRYTADGDWCSPLVSSAPAELSSVSCANLKGQNDE